jgi:hypothetical protein
MLTLSSIAILGTRTGMASCVAQLGVHGQCRGAAGTAMGTSSCAQNTRCTRWPTRRELRARSAQIDQYADLTCWMYGKDRMWTTLTLLGLLGVNALRTFSF